MIIEWDLLKENKCPKCKSDLWKMQDREYIQCTNVGFCNFLISIRKMDEIITDKVNHTLLDNKFMRKGGDI